MNSINYLLVADGSNQNPWNELVKIAEHGPGFQYIYVNHSSHKNAVPEGEYLVFNCELFIPYNPSEESNISTSFFLSYEKYIDHLKPVKRSLVDEPKPFSSSYNPLTLILSTKTCECERYWRLSAYTNDRRITSDNQIVTGTYLVPDSELAHISSGFGAVGRFALPNPFPSIYAFSVIPERGIDINLGTVRPAFGQAGGGVEAVIQSASGAWSVSNHKRVLPRW